MAIFVGMEMPPEAGRPWRCLPPRPQRSRAACACSVALHALVIGLGSWAVSGTYDARFPVATLHISRFSVQYLMLTDREPPTRAYPASHSSGSSRPSAARSKPPAAPKRAVAPRRSPAASPEGNPQSGPSFTASVATPPSDQGLASPRSAPQAIDAQELRPGEVAGIGRVVSGGTGAGADAGILDKLGFRPPTPEEIGAPKRGEDRVAELVTGTSSACPALEAPAAWPHPTLVVSVSFVVDTSGVVDHASIRVVASPGHPSTDRRYHAHVYVVAATMHAHARPMPPARYDSLVTSELRSHAASLTFRPALQDGQPVRSSVLISCQILQRG